MSFMSHVSLQCLRHLVLSAAGLFLLPATADSRLVTLDGQIVDIGESRPDAEYHLDCITNGVCVSAPFRLSSSLHRGSLVTMTVLPRPGAIPYLVTVTNRGSAPLAQPVPCDLAELATRHSQPSSVRGVIQSACRDETNFNWNWMTLQTPDGKLSVVAQEREFPLNALRRMIDAEVLLAGYPKPLNTWRTGLGQCLVLISDFPQKTLRPAPSDFQRIPEWNKCPSPHRRRVRGTVIARDLAHLYVRLPSDKFCEIQTSSISPDIRPGDSVSVAGFIETTFDGLRVTEALLERDPSSRPSDDMIAEISIKDLFPAPSGNDTISHFHCHKVVRLIGKVIGRTERPGGPRALLLSNGRHTIEIDSSLLPSDLYADLDDDCTIRVTGLCLANVEYNPAIPANLHFHSFSILPRTADDIAILRRPPWWTPVRLLVVIGLLTVALAAILVWNRTLSILSQRRGRTLFKEQIARATAELRTDERTRLAVELHDTIAQNLTGASFELKTIARLATLAPEKMLEHLSIVDRTLKSCRDDIRNCIWDLRTNSLDQKDLNQAINLTLSPHIGNAALHTRFNVPRGKLSDATLHALLRIVRELAINAVRHGNATELKVAGSLDDQALVFSVRDNGCGFDPETVPGTAQGHFGLQGIRERVKKLGGTLSIMSSPRQGSRIAVKLDLHTPSTVQQT